MTASSPIAKLVTEVIQTEGPISFADYMRIALYSDPDGYYRRNVPGPGADYRTSPTVSPAFGRLVARQLEQMWESLGRPDELRVVEVGAGGGDLAGSVLELAAAPFSRAINWCFVEPLASVQKLQAETLSSFSGLAPLRWVAKLDQLDPADGVVLANEVVDNMPFHLLEMGSEGAVNEIFVGVEAGRLDEVRRPLKDGPLSERCLAAAQHLEPGDRFEVCVEAEAWCRLACASLERGYLLCVDYGCTEPEIWLRHPAGTLLCYRAGALGLDPFEFPGDSDITAHVNFSALSRAAFDAGMKVLPLQSQREWLRSIGLTDIERKLRQDQRLAEQRGDHALALALLGQRSRVAALGYSGGLGSLSVFVASKGV